MACRRSIAAVASCCGFQTFLVIDVCAFCVQVGQPTLEGFATIVARRLQSCGLQLSYYANLVPGRNQSLHVDVQPMDRHTRRSKSIDVRFRRVLIKAELSRYADDTQLLRCNTSIFTKEAEFVANLHD